MLQNLLSAAVVIGALRVNMLWFKCFAFKESKYRARNSIVFLHAGQFFMLLQLSAAFFFKIKLLKKKFFLRAQKCQTVSIQVRTDVKSVQAVCKRYQQT